jgi:hypothetical protein
MNLTLIVSLFLCFICFAIDIFPSKNVSQPYFISEQSMFLLLRLIQAPEITDYSMS